MVEEARHDLQTMIERQSEFFASRPFAPFQRPSRGTDTIVYGLRPTAQIPGRIRAKANSALQQLRNALDQAVYAATVEIAGKPKSNNTYFPFCKSPEDFGDVVGGRCREIPLSLHPYLLSLEPYPTSPDHKGGNDLFRALGTVAGPAKHQCALALGMDVHRTDFSNLHAVGGGFKLNAAWLPNSNEFRIMEAETRCHVSFDVKPWLFIRFSDDGAIGKAPATTVLRDLAGMVERVVLGIEAEADRIVRARA